MSTQAEEHLLPCGQWHAEPQGAFALKRELALVQRMLSPWPRRGHNLLEVGCGCGGFLHFFWECGFDVTGLAPSPAHLEMARQHMQGKAELHLGALDYLPYEDKSFDYVALMVPPSQEDGPAPLDMVREAVRVSAGGVLLKLWNPFSLTGLVRRLKRDYVPEHLRHSLWLSWRHARSLLLALSPGGQVSTASTLLGPPLWWKEQVWSRRLNSPILPLPLGSVMLMRLTHASSAPLTGLPLRLPSLRMKERHPATVLERHNRHIQGRKS